MRMTDTTTQRPALPDHLSIDPRSPHHLAAVFEHDIGIRFNDKERFDVEEYCMTEGWIKVLQTKPWTVKASHCASNSKVKSKSSTNKFFTAHE